MTFCDGFRIIVYGGGGNDSITINAGTNHKIYGDDLGSNESGDDTITINNGSHVIHGGSGNDEIRINAGAGKQTVYSGAGNDTIIINAGSSHTIESGVGKDDIIVNLSKAVESFEILTSVSDKIDNLSINNATFDKLNFNYAGNKLHITSTVTGSEIVIDYWTSYQPFSEGTIKIGGVETSIAAINKKAGINS